MLRRGRVRSQRPHCPCRPEQLRKNDDVAGDCGFQPGPARVEVAQRLQPAAQRLQPQADRPASIYGSAVAGLQPSLEPAQLSGRDRDQGGVKRRPGAGNAIRAGQHRADLFAPKARIWTGRHSQVQPGNDLRSAYERAGNRRAGLHPRQAGRPVGQAQARRHSAQSVGGRERRSGRMDGDPRFRPAAVRIPTAAPRHPRRAYPRGVRAAGWWNQA